MIRLTVDMGPPRHPSYTVKEARTGRVLGSVRVAPGGRWQLYLLAGSEEVSEGAACESPAECLERGVLGCHVLLTAFVLDGRLELVADQVAAAEGGHVSLVNRPRR